MSKKNKKMQEALEARLEVLRDRVNAMEETLREPEDDDFEEQAVELDDDEVLVRLSRAGRTEAVLIEAALKRIEDGTYGKCITCGNPIPQRRLEALPEASQCVDCARQSTGS